ncbi:MAG: ATP-binding protein [Candidatus Brocadiales bacterium]
MKERCPFTPGHPVPPEYFIGRKKEIEILQRAMEQVALGKNENIFLTGERGIGKSSLASLCKAFASK